MQTILNQTLSEVYTLETLLRVDDFYLNSAEKLTFYFTLSTSSAAIWLAWTGNPIGIYSAAIISAILGLITMLIVSDVITHFVHLSYFGKLLISAVAISATLFALLNRVFQRKEYFLQSPWAIAILFIAMPHLYAFGTNNNYWQTGGSAGIFWLMAGIVLLGPLLRKSSDWLLIIPLVLTTQVVTVLILSSGMEHPYRQNQPLKLNSHVTNLRNGSSELILSKEYGSYIDKVIKTSKKANFKPNTPVIDLTGQSPGILYIMEAESIGLPWLIGGYPGSFDLAKTALFATPCEKIANAWILAEPDGPRSLPIKLAHNLGAAFPEKYKLVGIWDTAKGAGSYPESRTQKLYEPIEPMQTLKTCEVKRSEIVK